MRKAVKQLEDLGAVEPELLERNPAAGLFIERILWLLADQAFAVNTLVAVAACGERPRTPAASFVAVAAAGMISTELGTVLVPEDPHNVLVQLYMDTEPEKVEAVVSSALAGYSEYIERVAFWIADETPARLLG